MKSEAAVPTLQIGSYVSIGLGPLLSRAVPMASDLRPHALWVSALVSAATLAVFSVVFKGETKKSSAERAFVLCCTLAVICALMHMTINILWTTERGDFWDGILQVLLVTTFGFAVGGATGALSTAARIKQADNSGGESPG